MRSRLLRIPAQLSLWLERNTLKIFNCPPCHFAILPNSASMHSIADVDGVRRNESQGGVMGKNRNIPDTEPVYEWFAAFGSIVAAGIVFAVLFSHGVPT